MHPEEPILFPSLADIAGFAATDASKRICIVTPDLLGPVKNGGIGTACGYLALELASAGHDVEILFCQTGAEDIDPAWQDFYAARGIYAANAAAWQKERGEREIFPGLVHLGMAKTIYDWLRQRRRFDLILFMDWQGGGFYAMHARACGLAFADTPLCVVIHSPTYWHNVHNAAVAANPMEACLWHMERKAISMADAVISPSRYMLKWTADNLCRLPRHAFAQPNLFDWQAGAQTHDQPIGEIVFFGRLEYRKGLVQFCAALDILAKQKRLPPQVTFLGKCAWMGHEHSALYLARRARNWPGLKIRMLTQKGHSEAVEYISGPGRLAVMPSIADNSPYTVYECLAAGAPFLARNVGGIGEFLPQEQRQVFLFGDNPAELAQKITDAVGKPPKRGTLVIDAAENARAWRGGLTALCKLIKPVASAPDVPFISVILTHYNRPQLLRQAVASLYGQTGADFEVILADDGSADPAAIACLNELEPEFLRRGWRILRLENGHAAAARNRGAQAAKGDWLLFFDDDNVAMPHMLATCAQAASRREGGYVPLMFQVFEGNGAPAPENLAEIFLPTGDAIAYSTLANTLADTTALVSRAAFRRVGGFREDYGIGHEDFELFLRMALAGEQCAIIPEPLFWYRKSSGKTSVQLNTNAAQNRMRSLRPFLEALPPQLAELALMTHSMGATLRMYPDPDAERQLDLPLDRMAEPDSAANMIAVATTLANCGQSALAQEILEQIPADERPRLSALLLNRAIVLAKADDQAALRQLLAEMEGMEVDEAEIYEGILANLPGAAPKLRQEIMAKTAAIRQKGITAWLLLAGNAENLDEACDFILRALEEAEKIYLAGRADVAEATRAGAFVCGLQHFALHGKADMMSWPRRPAFSALLKGNEQLMAAATAAHMRFYRHNDVDMAAKIMGSLICGYEDVGASA